LYRGAFGSGRLASDRSASTLTISDESMPSIYSGIGLRQFVSVSEYTPPPANTTRYRNMSAFMIIRGRLGINSIDSRRKVLFDKCIAFIVGVDFDVQSQGFLQPALFACFEFFGFEHFPRSGLMQN
jgi:hypothetical protein